MRTSIVLFMLVLIFPESAWAMDVAISYEKSATDTRNDYPLALLELALQKTEEDFGPYRLERKYRPSSRNRALAELLEGKRLNIIAVASRPEWEEKAIPVYIPIMKDLLDYRLLLVHRNNRTPFEHVQTYEDLKQLRFGTMKQWTTTIILKQLGFWLVTTPYYEGLFAMLAHERFDALIRGVSEIYDEYEVYKTEHPELMIESRLALHLPMPTYFFVSPTVPGLAKRVEQGLRRAREDGSFDDLFEGFFGENKIKASLSGRHIIAIPNPYLQEDPLPGPK